MFWVEREEDLKTITDKRRKDSLKYKEHRSDRRRFVKKTVRDARITSLGKKDL